MLNKRPYTDADLPRLQEIMAGWIARTGRCGYDHIGELPHRIYENLRGRRPVGEVVHVWEHAGAPAGLTVNTRFGNAFDVLAAPELRGTDAEILMIEDAAATTGAATDAGEVLTDVFDCDVVRIDLLERLGFTRFRVWDDVREMALAGLPPEPDPPAGFTIRGARLSDADRLAEARNGAFQAGWTGAEYLEQVMRKPGYDPVREIVAEAPDGRVAAFAVHWIDPRNGLGHVEPVGTHPDFRRRGLARAVMLRAMHRMRTLTTVTVNHDAGNLAARKLYESLGFAVRHRTYGYRR